MKAEDALVGGLLSFPENYQVIEIKGEAKNVEEGLLEIAPDEIGKWQISKSDSALVALVTFKDVDLIISGIKKNILGWVIEFDGKLEKYETAEQMRDRVFELLK